MKLGDVVLVDFPFGSGAGAKFRPALVVQSEGNNCRLNSTIVAMITSTTHRARREATQLLIATETPEGKQSGLLHDSAVKCEQLFTIEQRRIRRTIGRLPASAMEQVARRVKSALDVS